MRKIIDTLVLILLLTGPAMLLAGLSGSGADLSAGQAGLQVRENNTTHLLDQALEVTEEAAPLAGQAISAPLCPYQLALTICPDSLPHLYWVQV
ncbi:MAG: hypothetical protein KDC54_20990 [Lewinella sp.]|nr:hypothetical protein [Lewinella sp.]